MTNTHLDALNLRLSHERDRLANAKTTKEKELRKVWVAGIEKEITAEYKFLGMAQPSLDKILMSDDELLRELGA